MNRRTFLRATGVGLAGLAGCLGPGAEEETEPPDGAEGTESPTETTTETPTGTETGTGTATETGEGDEQDVATHFRFGGRVEAWIGQEPGSIADEQNPRLELEAGTTYRVTWENLDGQPHDFTIQAADGTTLARTEQTSEEGATRSLTFTASDEMSQYVCTIHPTTMVADITISGGD